MQRVVARVALAVAILRYCAGWSTYWLSGGAMRSKPGLLPTLFLSSVLLSLTSAGRAMAQTASYSPDKLHDLENLDQLRTLFNAEKGTPRLILLLSPG